MFTDLEELSFHVAVSSAIRTIRGLARYVRIAGENIRAGHPNNLSAPEGCNTAYEATIEVEAAERVQLAKWIKSKRKGG